MNLHALLARRPNVVERARVHRAASHVAVLDPVVARALGRWDVPPPAPRCGDPLLLAAAGSEGSLWRVERDDDAPRGVELGREARHAWRLSARVAARALPVVADPAALTDGPAPRVVPLSCLREDGPGFDGPSAGLAFALLHLSVATGVPIAADLASSAELTPTGHLLPVRHIREKIEALRAWAPGVRRLLVAKGQDPPRVDGIAFIEVADVAEAWAHAFYSDGFDAALDASWGACRTSASSAAAGFFRYVLREPFAAVRWEAVARATAVLGRHLDGEDAWRAGVARAIATRHAGDPLHLPDPPPGLRPRRPQRLELLAQRIQAHTDLADPDWEDVARVAEREVAADGDEHPEDLKVLGALGRLHASWGRWEAAIRPLVRASHAWFDLDAAPEASRAICELLRVAGLVGDVPLLEEAESLAARCARDPRTPDHARAFLQLAIGRARATTDDPARASAALRDDAAPWAEAYASTRASRLRWQARLPRTSGRDDAFDALGALAASEPGCRFAWILARADRGDAAALDALEGADRRLWDRVAGIEPGAGLARRLCLFPY